MHEAARTPVFTVSACDGRTGAIHLPTKHVLGTAQKGLVYCASHHQTITLKFTSESVNVMQGQPGSTLEQHSQARDSTLMTIKADLASLIAKSIMLQGMTKIL